MKATGERHSPVVRIGIIEPFRWMSLASARNLLQPLSSVINTRYDVTVNHTTPDT
jgi:hypothetical protein